MDVNEELMNLTEVAEYLRIHPMTAYRLARKRQLPVFRVGGQYRSRPSILKAYLEEKILGNS